MSYIWMKVIRCVLFKCNYIRIVETYSIVSHKDFDDVINLLD